jgi:hypothetical protein
MTGSPALGCSGENEPVNTRFPVVTSLDFKVVVVVVVVVVDSCGASIPLCLLSLQDEIPNTQNKIKTMSLFTNEPFLQYIQYFEIKHGLRSTA